MSERVDMPAAAGLLAGDLRRATGDAVVLCAADLLSHRHWHGRYPHVAQRLARDGVSTLAFDFRGCGDSSDTRVTPESILEDWQAVMAFAHEAGFERLVLWGHGMLAPTCLGPTASAIAARVMSAGTTGPLTYDWPRAFGDAAVERLKAQGWVDVPSYDQSRRPAVRIDRSLLEAIERVDQASVCRELTQPLLCLQGDSPADGLEPPRLARNLAALPRLPAGSNVHVIAGATLSFAGHLDELADAASQWLADRLASPTPEPTPAQ